MTNAPMERRMFNGIAGAMRGLVGDAGTSRDTKIQILRRAIGIRRIPMQEVWNYAKAPFATGIDGWTDKQSNADAFWDLASAVEDPDAPGMLAGHFLTKTIENEQAAQYAVKCSCGWHAASVTESLRDWNVEGHIQYTCGFDREEITRCLRDAMS